jgi:hypothetical protein
VHLHSLALASVLMLMAGGAFAVVRLERGNVHQESGKAQSLKRWHRSVRCFEQIVRSLKKALTHSNKSFEPHTSAFRKAVRLAPLAGFTAG